MREIFTLLFLLVSLCTYPIVYISPSYFQENGRWYWGINDEYIDEREEVTGAHTRTFRLVCNSTNPYACFRTPFAKDRRFVYFQGQRIEGANPQTWEVIMIMDRSLYSRDDRNVFFRGKKVKGADRDTFEDISSGRHWLFGRHSTFGRDKNHIFFRDKPLIGSCANDFRILDIYVVSNNKVFFQNRNLDADAQSFQILEHIGHEWFGVEYTIARDKNHIFIDSQKLTALDVETFEIVDVYYWGGVIVRDKNGTFQIHHDWETEIASLVPIEIEKTGSGRQE